MVPILPRIQAAHNSLQLGEFLHHFCGQVGLAKPRRRAHRLAVEGDAHVEQILGEILGQPLYSHRFFVIAAQVFLEGHCLQQINALIERGLLVGLPEKSRIVEARPQHPLVAMPDQSLGIAVGIQHRQEMRQQLAAGIFHRKIFLMVAHHRDQHFFRQGQKFLVEISQNDRRPLRQIDHGIQQSLVFAPPCAGNSARRLIQRLANHLFALGGIHQHMSFSQGCLVAGS